MTPLLREHLVEAGAGNAPPGFLSRLQSEGRESAIRALFLSEELIRVLRAIRQDEVPAIPYKGPVLAARAYGNPTLRQFDDLDIVIPQRFMPIVFEQMPALGYLSKLPRGRFAAADPGAIPGEYVFVHRENRAMIEIHTERTLRHFPKVPDLNAMIRRATVVQVNGKEVPAFSREDDLLMLAVHGAKDFWARLIWIADVAELVKLSPPIAWTDLFTRANEMRIGRMLRLALLLPHKILELPLSPQADCEIRKDRMAVRLARQVRSQLFRSTQSLEGVWLRSLYRIGVAEGLWNGLRYWVRLSTAPAQEDWALLDLPRPLKRSYAILRPLRLWRKYCRRTSRSQ